MKHAIVVADPQGVIRHWSPDAEALFGHPAADAVGKSLDVIVPKGFCERPVGALDAEGARSLGQERRIVIHQGDDLDLAVKLPCGLGLTCPSPAHTDHRDADGSTHRDRWLSHGSRSW